MSRDAVLTNRSAPSPRWYRVVGLGLCRGDQADAAVIQRVDQVDEPPRGVAPRRVEPRNAIDQDGVEHLRQPEIVDRRQRLLAEIGEREARDAHLWSGPRHDQAAALDLDVRAAVGFAARQPDPMPVQLGGGCGVGGREIERSAGQLIQPEILLGLDLANVEIVLDQIDEGQKQLAVQAMAIELGRDGRWRLRR